VRTALVAAVLALLLILSARSEPRLVGDSAEYVAVSLNLDLALEKLELLQ